MTETLLPLHASDPHPIEACPTWCVLERGVDDHAHVSADVTAGPTDQLLSARLVQMPEQDAPRVLVNGRVADLEELEQFVHGLQRLLDDAHLAPAGLDFVGDMIKRAGLTLAEAAEAAGLEVSWIRSQNAGGQVLTVREYDRLALAVAGLSVAAVPAR